MIFIMLNNIPNSIIRARKVSLVYPNTKQIAEQNPIRGQFRKYFLLSAIHEIRNEEKIKFLKEVEEYVN